jgi:putative intracellular protease/amidase
VLAAVGLLDGKRATTHWAACAELARRFPAITVDGNAIFVRADPSPERSLPGRGAARNASRRNLVIA